MVLFKVQLGLDLCGVDQGFDVAQAPGLLGVSPLTGLVDCAEGMTVDQADQAHQGADGFNAPVLLHRLSPGGAGSAQVAGSTQPIVQVGLKAALTAADAARIGELARFLAAMDLDLLESTLLVLDKDPDLAAVIANPHIESEVFRRHMVKSPFHLDVTVAMNGSSAFAKAGEQTGWQGLETGLFRSKQFGHLLFGGAMNTHVGHRLLPVLQELVQRRQRGEVPPRQPIAFHILDAAFDFSFVFRCSWQTGKDRDVVVTGKIDELGVEFWVGPVEAQDRGLKVVEVDGEAGTPEVAEGIFQAAEERFGVLTQDRLAVSLARMAQDHSEDPGLALLSLRGDQGGSLAKVDLHLPGGLHFDALNQRRMGLAQPAHIAFDRLVGTGKGALALEVLVDALGTQPGLQLGEDQIGVIQTEAFSPIVAGGRNWVSLV